MIPLKTRLVFTLKRAGNAAKKIPTLAPLAYNMPEKLLYAYGLKSTEKLCLPDFLVIGAQKAGTSWLWQNFRRHPDVFLPERKEQRYFDWYFHENLAFYSDRFIPGRDKVKGEATPGYSRIPPWKIRYIKRLMPDVKLVFIMRNPIERAWSHALMDLVMIPEKKFEDVDDSAFIYHFNARYNTKLGDYVTILDNWLAVFPEEQVYVGFFEDIKNRPRELLEEIFVHIGVSTDVQWEDFPYNRVMNKGPKVEMPDHFRAYLRDMYAGDIGILSERFGDRVKDWK